MSISEKSEENKIDIREIERKIYAAMLAAGRAAMAERLEVLDDALAESRDRKSYRDKGKRRTVLKTIMGEVEFSRRVYEAMDESGSKVYVYLLDEALGIDGPGQISPKYIQRISAAGQ